MALYRVIPDAKYGRGLYAVKDTPAFSEVFREEPLIHALFPGCFTKMCHWCLRRSDDLHPCQKCKLVWYCGSKCRKADLPQHGNECCKEDWIQLLKEVNDENFQRFRVKSLAIRARLPEVGSKLNSLYGESIDNKISINGMTIMEGTNSVGSAIYETYALLNHSCTPNCGYFFDGKTLTITTLEHIPAGAQFFVTYVHLFELNNHNPLLFLNAHGFESHCEHCDDLKRYPYKYEIDMQHLEDDKANVTREFLKLSGKEQEDERNKMLKRYKPNDSKPYCTKVGTAHALQWIFDNQLEFKDVDGAMETAKELDKLCSETCHSAVYNLWAWGRWSRLYRCAEQLKNNASGICLFKAAEAITKYLSPNHPVARHFTHELCQGVEESIKKLKEEAEVLQQYEEALKQGEVKMSIIKCLALGIAGVGKTHFKWLLLDQRQASRVSTGLADNPVQAFVGSVSSMLAGVDEEDPSKWEVIDENKLTQIILTARQMETSPPITSNIAPQSNVPDNPVVNDPSVTSPSPSIQPSQITPWPKAPNYDLATDETGSKFFDCFKNVTERKPINVKLIHFIDSGGQPQFLEILPAFVQDVSATILAINLSESLDHCPLIEFYGPDHKSVGEPYTSPLSHKQVLQQCVRAVYSRNVGRHVFIVGTHRDLEEKCPEPRKSKEEIIRSMNFKEDLICKPPNEVIWDINGKDPSHYDREVAATLRRALVTHCSDGTFPPLPIKWFYLTMELMREAEAQVGVLRWDTCKLQAEKLGIDSKGLDAALRHMVKYNLLLWYHDIRALRHVVFCNPQAILGIITKLVKCKYELSGGKVDQGITSNGVPCKWHSQFDHAIVSMDFLSHNHFQNHFIDDVFTVDDFTTLMCALFLMVPLEGNKYLMPALLNPLSNEKIGVHIPNENPAEPLLITFSHESVLFGIFSCLIAFLLKTCSLLEKNSVPVCLHQNCVLLKHQSICGVFAIVDSVNYLRVYFMSGQCEVACPKIRTLIYEGIKECANARNCIAIGDVKDAFICSSCGHPSIPYTDTPNKARCTSCPDDLDLTTKHSVWFGRMNIATCFNGNSSVTLGEDDLFDVMNEVVDLASCWYNFGLALRLKPSHLDTIASKNHDPTVCLRDMLKAWLQHTALPSWKILWTAVENRVGGNKPSLAKKIKERHS